MSWTCRLRISAFRMPVEYSTISIVRSVRLPAASINRVTSSTRQDGRQPARHLGIRDVVEGIPPLQRLHEEEPERRDMELHGPRLKLPLAQEVRLVLAEVRLIELVRRRWKCFANRSTAWM